MNTTSAVNNSSSDHGFLDVRSLQLLIVAESVNLVLGFPLNCYVMWLILRASRESIASDFFSLNLAMSESFFCLSSMWIFISVELKSFVVFEAYTFCIGLLSTARPLFQCCICMEYYAGVLHPVLYLRFKPLRYKLACCSIMWLIILLSCIYSLYTYHNSLYLYAIFIQSVLLFCVMLFSCLSVLRALKRPGPGDKDIGKKKTNKMKRKAFKIILLIVIFMALNFFLFMAVIPLQSFLQERFDHIFGIFATVAMTTGFIQPLLYLHRAVKLPCVRKI